MVHEEQRCPAEGNTTNEMATMHLLFCANNDYVPHVATTLASIFENNKDISFVVHLLVTDISAQNRDKLVVFFNKYNQTIDLRVVDPTDFDIDESVCGKWGIFPSLKLYAAEMFYKIDRILYIDADMICLGSLRPIEKTNLTDYYVAMVTDASFSTEHKKRLGLNKDDFYGCAGVVLFNLNLWRRDNIRQRCLSYFNNPQNRDIIKYGEQDVMNAVLQSHIRELPIEYNMMSNYWEHNGLYIPEKYRMSIKEHRKNAVIIHYIGDIKPWFKDCRFPLKKYYWQYHHLTPWGEQNYGYSKLYAGRWESFKKSVHEFLHKVGLKSYYYAYDC